LKNITIEERSKQVKTAKKKRIFFDKKTEEKQKIIFRL